MVMASLQDVCQANWVQEDKAHLLAFSFDVFFAEFKATFPPLDWETNTRNAILNTWQKASDSFVAFAYSVQAQNMLLVLKSRIRLVYCSFEY